MCFSISFNISPNAYVERYTHLINNKIQDISDINNSYFISAFDFPELPIVTKSTIIKARWGLIPHWFKGTNINEIKTKILNIRIETLSERSSFSNLLNNNKCLLGITGFFEWRHYNNKKYPYFIKVKSQQIFSLGCLYDVYKFNGINIITFSIITTSANSILEKIHNTKKRMPLIIDINSELEWLNSEINNSTLKHFVAKSQNIEFDYYTVSNILNFTNKNRNTPEAIQPFLYENLPEL